ncbi:hypothetical protein IM511_05400 [Erythrobacteraceae bacterium E2-1 Yellow Sea]|nr:hypothetical protein [Erythrobacteraceae bacterium E2-1 Yellow Sea]
MDNDDDIPNPWQGEPEPGPLTPGERMLFEGRPPPPPHLIELGRTLVGRAKLKFKDFRIDRENIECAAVASARNGELAAHDAEMIFSDRGDIVSYPLAQRYIEMREFELMARYLKTRLHYTGFTHMTPRNRLIFDGMIAGGETSMAVVLLRKYLAKVREYAQNRWRNAGAKMRPDLPPEYRPQFEDMKAKEIRELPAQLDIAELEIAEIETYLAQHGSREDNRALEKFREEIAKVRKRFNLPQKRL